MRLLPLAAVFVVLVMTGLAIWQISESPGVIPDVRRSSLPSPTPGEPIEVPVEPGLSPGEIGEMLEEAGIIDSAVHFQVLVGLLGYDQLLQAGDYEFDGATPALQVLYRMRRGIISPRFVTVIEGWRLEQIADALDEKAVISREEFLEAAVAGNFGFDFLRRLGPATTLDGYLFPATYFYRSDDRAEDLIQQMLEAMDTNFTPELRAEALDKGLTMHTVLTIASIVEREAVVPEERPIIAQVFLTRLARGIRLEADPTVQYAIAADPAGVERYGYWKEELTEADLAIDSPYNTYEFFGRPPGPIASPSLDSILAVIRPAGTNYLFFVAKPDGSHAFAETLEEHLENVERYQGGSE